MPKWLVVFLAAAYEVVVEPVAEQVFWRRIERQNLSRAINGIKDEEQRRLVWRAVRSRRFWGPRR